MRPKVTKTYEEVMQYIQAANAWLAIRDNKQTALAYAMMRVSVDLQKALGPIQDDRSAEIEDIRGDYADTDDKGYIIRDASGQFAFKPTRLKEFNAAVRKINKKYAEKEVAFPGYYATKLPELNPFEMEAFAGIVVDPAKFDAMCALYEAPEANSASDSIS